MSTQAGAWHGKLGPDIMLETQSAEPIFQTSDEDERSFGRAALRRNHSAEFSHQISGDLRQVESSAGRKVGLSRAKTTLLLL